MAASSGSLKTLRFLIEMGADYRKHDSNQDGPVHRAILHFHTHLVEYFIQLTEERQELKKVENLQVWKILIGSV